jgi:hypothetical protein
MKRFPPLRRDVPLGRGTPLVRAECVSRASAILARAAIDTAWVYAEGGAQAVTEAAYEPGGPSVEEIAAMYERMDPRARRERLRSGATGGLTSEQAWAAREQAIFRRLAADRALPDAYQEQ